MTEFDFSSNQEVTKEKITFLSEFYRVMDSNGNLLSFEHIRTFALKPKKMEVNKPKQKTLEAQEDEAISI